MSKNKDDKKHWFSWTIAIIMIALLGMMFFNGRSVHKETGISDADISVIER